MYRDHRYRKSKTGRTWEPEYLRFPGSRDRVIIHRLRSTVVISQFPVSTWFDMFANNTYADACLTHITDKHHTYRLEMNGINMRETE